MEKTMKVFVFSAFFLMCNFILKTQTLELYNDNNELLNYGDTITVFGDIQISELIAVVKIKNVSTTDVQVSCHKQYISIVEGTTNTFCWANSCYPPTTFNAPAMTIPAGTITDKFSAEYYPNGIAGESIIKYTFKVVNGDSAYIFIKFSVSAGFDYYSTNYISAFLNPTTGYLIVTSPAYSKIKVYTSQGILLKEIVTLNKQTQIYMPEYKGIIIVIIEKNNKVLLRRKFFKQ